MWDPYGSVDHLPVAVVNEDKPVDYDGTTLSVGKDMVEELSLIHISLFYGIAIV